jgi:hypothetical protein
MGIEEVHADHVLRARGGRRELDDWDRRGVRREQGVRVLDVGVELGEDVDLERLVLGDRLDDERAVGEAFQAVAEPDRAERALGPGPVEGAAPHGPVDRAGHRRAGPFHPRPVLLDEHHVEATARADLGDSRPHQPAAQDTDFLGGLALGRRPGPRRPERRRWRGLR